MAIVTISRIFGAGGLTLGKILAEQLGYEFLDNEVIQMVAEKANVSSDIIDSVEAKSASKFKKMISGIVPKTFLDRINTDQAGAMNEAVYVDLLDKIIKQLAEKDNLVILGRGSQFILKDNPKVVNLLLTANKANRLELLKNKYDITGDEAERALILEDDRRRNLYMKFNVSDYNNCAHYHLCLNMNRMTMDEAVRVVCKLVQSTH